MAKNKIVHSKLESIILNQEKRAKFLFLAIDTILALVSLFMTFVNIKTGEITLMWFTLGFAALAGVNALLGLLGSRVTEILARVLLLLELPVLFGLFIVTGHPQGFSAIWTAIVPSTGLLLFGAGVGSLLSSVVFLELVFFFWIPAGQNLLMWDYSETFMLRFPMLYLAFFILSFILAAIIKYIQKAYYDMSRHDTLTGALTRQGFEEEINNIRENLPENKKIGFIIGDLDFFKKVNDTYGHFAGDKVLVFAADVFREVTGAPVCRWGGEEIAVFLENGEDTTWIAEKIRVKMESAEIDIGETKIKQTISLGAVCTGNSKDMDGDALCRIADQCLYMAKETGRNKVVSNNIK